MPANDELLVTMHATVEGRPVTSVYATRALPADYRTPAQHREKVESVAEAFSLVLREHGFFPR